MIQFNLLPDVKVQYMKTKQLKRVMLLASLLVTAVSVLFLFLTFSYTAFQKRHLSNLDTDITKLVGEFESNTELTKILSVQNQLSALPALYDGRPAVDRLPGYLEQTTPNGVSIRRLMIDFSTSAVEIIGQADRLEQVNAYVDTLKYTSYKTNDEGAVPASAFSGVILTQFSRDVQEASFTINLTFDPMIFNNTKQVELTIPNLTTTRAGAATVEELFMNSVDPSEQEGQNGGQ